MFIYITFLMFGLCYQTIGTLLARYLYLTEPALRDRLIDTFYWGWRPTIVLCVVLAIVLHMSYRAFWQRKR